ncbi:MAG: YggS family pyridoxal phosphate-dependent enzyme [Lentisphaeria bacterium]
MNNIKENLELLHEQINRILTSCGRNKEELKLLAVSKTFPIETILDAYQCGQRMFGENRTQELLTKVPNAPKDCEWHLIGHLQKNKVRTAVENAAWIHAVDSVQLITRIDRLAKELNKQPKLLLEVNISGEDSKFGLKPDKVEEVLTCYQSLKSACPCLGLMTIAPQNATSNELHKIFGDLRKLRDTLSTNTGMILPELSMGMSGDFKEAVEEGATIVRVGSAVFGHRDIEQKDEL